MLIGILQFDSQIMPNGDHISISQNGKFGKVEEERKRKKEDPIEKEFAKRH